MPRHYANTPLVRLVGTTSCRTYPTTNQTDGVRALTMCSTAGWAVQAYIAKVVVIKTAVGFDLELLLRLSLTTR